MIFSGRVPVNGHSEMNRLAIFARTKHKMQIARMEMKYDLPRGRLQHSKLLVIDPFARKSPLVQPRLCGSVYACSESDLIPPGDAKCSARS